MRISGNLLETSFLSGSYKRDTAIRPKASEGAVERPDVDIIVQTTHTLSDSPAHVVDSLYSALKSGYSEVRKQQAIRRRRDRQRVNGRGARHRTRG